MSAGYYVGANVICGIALSFFAHHDLDVIPWYLSLGAWIAGCLLGNIGHKLLVG